MPSSFKAFIENNFLADGTTSENLTRQKVIFITSRGTDLRPGLSPWAGMDALTSALRSSFAFFGVANSHFVDAKPLQFSDQTAREEALKRAYSELDSMAKEWIS